MAKPYRAVASAAVVMLALAACSTGTNSGAPTPSNTPSSTPTPTVTTPAITTPTAVPPSTPAATTARTAANLTKALLTLADLPAGFSLEKDDSSGGADVAVSSKDSRCARLVAYTNADNPPGSKASADQSYSGGAQGPFIDESIDALASPAAVRALQKSFKQAVAACRTMTLKIPGEGSSPITVRQVSAPQAGTDPLAVRFTATSGPLEGFEVTMVTAGVDDVVLAITVINGLPEDIDGATTTAAEKAQDILGTPQSGT
jgi:hypothetical protein